MNSKISTVIVRWRNGKELERCIASLLAHGGSELEEIIVVDSGSGDGGGERLQQAFHNIEVVQLEHNRSFAWAANQGVARTCGDFVLLLNPDTEITEGSLEVLVGYLMEHPNAAGAVPLLVEPDGSSQHHWQLRCLPRLRDLALGRSGRPQFPNSPTQPTQAEQPAAAAWCIRRVVWDALEGLHSGFAPAWWEDVDFCVRLAALEQVGGSVDGMWLVPQARIVHHGGSSLPHLSATEFVTMFSRNLMRFAERHYSNQIWWLRPCLTAALLAKAIARPSLMASYVAAARTVIRHTTNE